MTMIAILAFGQSVSAHYLWVLIDRETGPNGSVKICFEHGPGPGDGSYLDPFEASAKTSLRTPGMLKPEPLKTVDTRKDAHRWHAAALPAGAPRSIDSYWKFGVYRYGTKDVLLHYYGRNLDITSRDDLKALSRASQMNLDIVISDGSDGSDGALSAQALWMGKPAANRPVEIKGPQGFRQKLTTDADGNVTFRPATAGQYTVRTSVEELEKSGTDNGKTYSMVRHHATMMLRLPLKN
nr:hypothetical protein [uncultured bacterium]